MNDAPPVEVRGLVKTYGDITAVDDVDLTVDRGDVFGYLGPNGAGKTTSLRMMLGLIRPTAGSVRIFGRDPQLSVTALEGVAGFVEAPRFYPYLDGRTNLRLLAALDGGDAPTLVEEVLDVVELTGRGKDKVGGYSHGMRQRLGIAAALLRRPRLLILDEPATGLDPGGMRDMRLLIRRLADDGITVLLSSHLLAEVEELCNRVAIVRKGSIVYEGALDDLRRTAGASYRLRTTDDDRARRVCEAQPGIDAVETAPDGAITFRPAGDDGDRPALARTHRGRRAAARARAADGDTRGPVLRADRGRRRARGRHAAHRTRRRDRRGAHAMSAPGTLTIYRWELRKLRSQKRTYLGLGAAAAVPIIFAIAVAIQPGGPEDVPFGRYIKDTGLAIPLVLLLFGSIWLFPLITALVAGDIVAAEDHNGTLKTILTRSVERGQIYVAKMLAAFSYAALAILVTGSVAIVAGIIVSGFNPITTLSGTQVSASKGLTLVIASLGVYLMPIIAIACIGMLFSTLFRNSAAAIVGTLMFSLLLQLLTIVPGLSGLQPYLLSTQFNAWQGLLRTPADWEPIIRAAWVCALYAVPSLVVGFLVFLRRDVTEG